MGNGTSCVLLSQSFTAKDAETAKEKRREREKARGETVTCSFFPLIQGFTAKGGKNAKEETEWEESRRGFFFGKGLEG